MTQIDIFLPQATEEEENGSNAAAVNTITFSGYDLKEDEVRELLLRSTKGFTYHRKHAIREEQISVRELSEIQRLNATKPMPDGWFFNGHSYVSLDGQRSQNHPRFEEFLAEHLRKTNEEIEEHNKMIEELMKQFELTEMTQS